MFIGYLRVNIFIPHSRSLKEKRQVILKVRDRVRNKFNVSIAERPSNKWQVCELSFACVNYTKKCVYDTMFKIEEFIRFYSDIQILNIEKEIL
jgi:hypothetical protein